MQSVMKKKDLALYLLKKMIIDKEDREIMKYIIGKSSEPNTLDIIIRLMCKILYTNSDCKITKDLIDRQVMEEKETLKILKPQSKR